jgi:heme/copper-type cytochrome/quinol oxidase subunit 1
MHPLRHPRNAALVGIIFVLIAIVYYLIPSLDGLDLPLYDIAAGTTLLLFLGVAMAIMAYVLVAGSSDE